MATAPAWARKRCTTLDDVVVPIFGKERPIARGMANAVLRWIASCEAAQEALPLSFFRAGFWR